MKLAIILMMILFVASACESTPPATLVTFDTFCNAENADKQVAIEGYPYLPSSMLITDTILVDLFERTNSQGREFPISLKVGTGANQVVEPPDDYTDADLLIRTQDNQEVRAGTKIRVEGRVLRSQSIDDPEVYNCLLFEGTNIQIVTEQ